MIALREAAEFLSLLNQNKVQYLIIGGMAVNIHGYTRATSDLDIWYKPSKENYEALLKSIQSFGFEIEPIKKLSNNETKGFVRLPMDPFCIELLATIDGKLGFDTTYAKAYMFDLQGTPVPVIGYDELIQNKIMSRRAKDLEDIAQLERRRNQKN